MSLEESLLTIVSAGDVEAAEAFAASALKAATSLAIGSLAPKGFDGSLAASGLEALSDASGVGAPDHGILISHCFC